MKYPRLVINLKITIFTEGVISHYVNLEFASPYSLRNAKSEAIVLRRPQAQNKPKLNILWAQRFWASTINDLDRVTLDEFIIK